MNASIVSAQVNSSNDNNAGYGYTTTTGQNYRIGGNYGPIGETQIHNLYLSHDNGLSFLNSGDGPTTAINLPTSIVGTFTYQFYCGNAWAEALTLQLWTSAPDYSGPAIVVSTQHDADPDAFVTTFDSSTAPPFVFPVLAPLPAGSNQTTIDGFVVTLTEFAFTNGSGPASAFDVTPGAVNTPEVYGHFTFEVEAIPEPSALLLAGTAAFGLFGFARRRRFTSFFPRSQTRPPDARAASA